MIPKEHIVEWKETVPWTDAQMVEQDLIICRALVAIYDDEFLSSHLAFRGGTALHKLYLSPQPRYSEDIDLVQIKPESIGAILDRLRKVLSFLGKPIIKQKQNNNTLVFKTESTFPPIIPIRLKIEINCKEHFSVLGLVKIPFEVKSQWFNGSCEITTYQLDELIGTKLRALYQRKKGRDLFDLWKALENPNLNTKNVVKCYRRYIEFSDGDSPTQTVYIANMEEKMQEDIFLNDTQALLRPILTFNPQEAYEIVKRELIEKI
ncbi:MAG: nucleotidyl transferase AbiEii/AbiGii toxin family protein [Bacteroidales bacterium]|jgi:predicted nucleotidyltransferase component of viral defense system|nr:nucleotidyl transferase AbiEii/AbiGii toxin family protein [Bacteroidales bacterium]MCK9497981.1 nucleotidyl transferase AbiEii/AbiGii toxin family protein [Bacteroidales bacterium]MDY0314688.1 nucleotidyl transferase AbiEii/AbiGii toxin family protein [Bacteroidales bacterium]NLB86328.1 nucleotidyl transferase AbiEii/AbiGii toxin family protein [Bacteroidales bacterium]